MKKTKHNRNQGSGGKLVSIMNERGSYFFSHFGNNGDESPVLKIKGRRNIHGKVHYQLIVMEVLYPKPLYHSGTNRQNILHALRDGIAVVRETGTVISFIMNPNYKMEDATAEEVDFADRIEVEKTIKLSCYVGDYCSGNVEVLTAPRYKINNLRFFLTANAEYGDVELETESGFWSYTNQSVEDVIDSFEVTVWNMSGSFATQIISINCENNLTSGEFQFNDECIITDSEVNDEVVSYQDSHGISDFKIDDKGFLSLPILVSKTFSEKNFQTIAVDVSQLKWYTYAFYVNVKGTVTFEEQIAVLDSDKYFISTGESITLSGVSAAYTQKNPPILQYSQINLKIESEEDPEIEVFLQGQY